MGRVFLSPIFFLGPHHGSLAQQVRALALQARGRRFESVNSHQHGVVTMSINQLAAFLFRISGTCKVHATMRRCIHVLRNRPDITSEALILKNLTDLLLELDKTPVYTEDLLCSHTAHELRHRLPRPMTQSMVSTPSSPKSQKALVEIRRFELPTNSRYLFSYPH